MENVKLLSATNSWRIFDTYNYYFYDDADQDKFMRDYFPDIYGTYSLLPLPVMKADLWRYCVIYKYGGIYADIDTICLSSPDKLINRTLLCGVAENDVHLCQWVFAAPKESPILKAIVDLSVERIRSTQEFRDEHFVHELTGPGVFCDGIESWLLKNNFPVLKNNRSHYKSYCKNLLHIYDKDQFHKNDVEHLFAGRWDDGWCKQREKLLVQSAGSGNRPAQ